LSCFFYPPKFLIDQQSQLLYPQEKAGYTRFILVSPQESPDYQRESLVYRREKTIYQRENAKYQRENVKYQWENAFSRREKPVYQRENAKYQRENGFLSVYPGSFW